MKQDLITRIAVFVHNNLEENGYCYRLLGNLTYKGKETHVFSSAFSELDGERGKLFFRIIENKYPRDEWDVLAEDCTEEELQGIINDTNKVIELYKHYETCKNYPTI